MATFGQGKSQKHVEEHGFGALFRGGGESEIQRNRLTRAACPGVRRFHAVVGWRLAAHGRPHHGHGAHGRAHARAAAVAVLFFLVTGGALAIEDVEAVDEVDHAIGVDGVVPRVAAHLCVDGAAHVALLVQDVVELQADGGGVAFEEALGNLGVPYKLVGVHRGVGIATARAHGEVGREGHAPREVEVGIGTVREVPRIHVGVRLQLVARVLIVHAAKDAHVEPRGAV